MAPSSTSSTNSEKKTEIPNPPTVIKRNLRNAERISELAHNVDASPTAQNTALFHKFLKNALINLESNAIIFDAVMPTLEAEEAARLEPLRVANETALVGVRGIQDADKVRVLYLTGLCYIL